MITESLFMLGEVNYASFGSKTATTTTDSGTAISTPIKGTGTDLLVGIGYRF
jgi:hypothetical protein